MTSLSEQLLRLALPEGSLGLTSEKTRPSLLFTAKDAALFDRDTIYNLGANGFAEVCLLVPSFHALFHEELFSEGIKDMERTMQTQDFNAQLDKTIDLFLLHISQYFLLRPAQKCIEWLIYRFHIHSFNVTGLIRCIIPYHATNVFVHAVKVLQPKKSSGKWAWLKNIQEENSPFTTKHLALCCTKDPSFFQFICDMVLAVVKVKNSPQYSCSLGHHANFFTGVLLGMIHDMGTISNKTLSHIMPILMKSFASESEEFQAFSILVLSQLSVVVSFGVKAFENLLHHCTKYCLPSIEKDLVQLIMLMCETQESVKVLPGSCWTTLLSYSCFPQTVAKLSSSKRIEHFLTLLFNHIMSAMSVAENHDADVDSVWMDLLTRLQLSPALQAKLLRLLLQKVFPHKSSDQTSIDSSKNKQLLAFFQQKYSVQFDTVVTSYFQHTSDHNDDMVQFLATSLGGGESKDSFSFLTIGLLHPASFVRAKTLAKLSVFLTNHLDDDDAHKFAYDHLKRILDLDSDESVVLECIKMLRNHPSLLDGVNEDIYDQLIKLLVRERFSVDCNKSVLTFLLSKPTSLLGSSPSEVGSGLKVFVLVLHVLIKSRQSSSWKTETKSILSSKFVMGTKLLVKLRKTFSIEIDNKTFFADLVANLSEMEQGIFHSMLEYWNRSFMMSDRDKNCVTATYWMILHAYLRGGDKKDDDVTATFQYVVDALRNEMGSIHAASRKLNATDCLPSLIDQCISGEPEYLLVPFMALSIKQSIDMLSQFAGQNMSGSSFFMLQSILFDLILTVDRSVKAVAHSSNVQKQFYELLSEIFKKFFTDLLPSAESSFQFLSRFLEGSAAEEIATKLQVLYLTNTLLASLLPRAKECGLSEWLDGSILLPTILLASASSDMKIRSAAIQCMKVVSAVPSCNASLLAMFLCEKSDEIVADPASIKHMLRLYFDEDKTPWHKKNRLATKTRRNALLKTFVDKHVLAFEQENQTSNFGLKFLCLCLHEVVNPVMFFELFKVAMLFLDRKTDWKENDLKFVACVAEKSVTSRLKTSDVSSLLCKVFKLNAMLCQEGKDDSPVHVTLNLITKTTFVTFSEPGQKRVIAALLDLQATNTSTKVSTQVAKVFKLIPLQAEHLIVELEKCRKNIKCIASSDKKSGQADSMDVDADIEEPHNIHLKRLIALLEVLQQKKQIYKPEILCGPLCVILQELMMEKKIQDPGEYFAQLLIGSLLNFVRRVKTKEVEKAVTLEVQKNLQLELIVNCIQMSENTLLHRQAILLLAEAVHFFPDKIVHVIMSIFTFMGTSLLRKDDSYSFQVITQTIQSIVPALMTHNQKRSSSSVDVVLQIVQVFVDALPHIPTHRRLTVFEELLRAVDPHKYLWMTLLLILDQHFNKSSNQHSSTGEEDTISLEVAVDTCESISRLFDTEIQIISVEEILTFLHILPSEFDKGEQQVDRWGGFRSQIFDVKKRTSNQLCNFRLASLIVLSRLLSHGGSISHSFDRERGIMRDDPSHDIALIASRMEKFESVLLKALQLDQSIARLKERAVGTKNVSSQRYYDVLGSKMVEVLDKINLLLPTGTMLLIVSSLLQQHAHEVHLKLMRLLLKRISYGFKLNSDEVPLFQSVAEHLVNLLLHKCKCNLPDMSTHQNAAASTLARVVKICGMSSSTYFTSIIPILCEFVLRKDIAEEVLSSSLVCLGELFTALKAHCIVHLSSVSPSLIKLLGRKDVLQNDEMLLATIKAVFALFQAVANFLTPHLVEFLSKLAPIMLLCQQTADDVDGETTQAQKKIKLSKLSEQDYPQQVISLISGIFNILAKKLTSRVLFPAFNTCYEKITSKCPMANASLVELANRHLASLDKKDLSLNSSLLFSFYMKALDFRTERTELSSEKIKLVEDHVLDGVITLLLKLPEEEFQFVYHKLYVWGCSSDAAFQRSTTFYRCINLLANKLKGLFTIFAVELVTHIQSMLEVQLTSYDDDLTKEGCVEDYSLRMSNAVEMMTTLLQHDESFMNQERFDLICSPLVDEMEKIVDEETEVQKISDYVRGHVLPCLGHLAMCTNNNIGWRTLHDLVLAKTRHNRQEIRRCALDAILAIGQKLGEDYMTMVPDTVPFLAELMEDDNAEVEKHCQRVITQLEEAVGESLQKYF